MLYSIFKFFILFVIVFGPKFGFFDSRLLLLPLLLFFDLRLNQIIKTIIYLFFYFLLKELIFSKELDFNELLRLIKLFYVLVLIHVFSKKFKYNLRDIGIILLVHVFFIILMNEFQIIRDIIHNIYSFSKSYKQYRSTGLTIGYDISGFLAIISFIIWKNIDINIFVKNVILIVIIISVILTSRVSLLILSSLIIFYSKDIIFNNKTISFFLFFIIFILIKDKLIEIYTDVKILLGFVNSDLKSYGGYAIYSYDILFEQIFIWPTNFKAWLLGYNAEKVDSGYSMILMKYGIIGFLFILNFYWKLIKMNNSKNNSFLIIILLFFILNFKNEYFLTRGITEVLLLLAFLNEKK